MNFLPLPVRRACWCFDILLLLLLLCCFYRNALASSRVMYVFSFISTNVLIVSFVWLVQLPNTCFLVSFNTYFTCSCGSLALHPSTRRLLLLFPRWTLSLCQTCAQRSEREIIPCSLTLSDLRCHQPFQVDWFAFSKWYSCAVPCASNKLFQQIDKHHCVGWKCVRHHNASIGRYLCW